MFSREANFFDDEKVETVRTHLFAERKGASENVAPVGIKLRMRKLEKLGFARKNSAVQYGGINLPQHVCLTGSPTNAAKSQQRSAACMICW